MFCPNCGKDSGDFKFCPHCGTKIPAAEPSAAWSVGMPCPHCGGTKLDGKNCAFCGAQLMKNTSDDEYSGFPLGTYDGGSIGTLILEDNSVVVRRWIPFRNYEQRIAYNQLIDVRYIRGSRKQVGFLTIRWKGNEDIPLPMTYSQCCMDKTTVPFSVRCNADFYNVYRFLQTKAPKDAQFRIYNSF